MTFNNIFLTTAILTSLPITAFANNCSSDESEWKSKVGEKLLQVGGETIESAVANGSTAAQITTTQNDTVAEIRIANGYSSQSERPCRKNSTYSSQAWNLTLSAPLEKGNEPKQIATLDGLATSFSFGLKFSHIETRQLNASPSKILEAIALTEENLQEAKAGCLELASTDEDAKRCEAVNFGPDSEDPDAFILKYNPNPIYAEEKILQDAYSIWYSGEAKLGYEDFSFIDPNDLSASSKTGVVYSASASLSYSSLRDNRSVYSLGATFESAFDQSDQSIVCLNNEDDVSCVSGRAGEPKRSESLIGFAEARYAFDAPGNLLKKIGVAPRVSQNFSKDITGVSVPIYFIPAEGALSSGIQVGWRSDTDDVSAGIFIGGTFDLFQ